MGKFKHSDLGRLMAFTAATWAVWAGLWAIAYRKFFWDMVGAQLGPTGLVPTAQAAPFIIIIVDFPLVQIITVLFGLTTCVLEWGFDGIEATRVGRSVVLRVVLYILFAAVEILLYQGVDCTLYYLIAAGMYGRALAKGEAIGCDPADATTDGEKGLSK